MKDVKAFIAKNVALMLHDGEVVNLGIGIPTLVASYLPEGVNVILQAESGIVGAREAGEDEKDPCLRDAGGAEVALIEGGSTVDSAGSFGLIRGHHVETTVLGALEVDEQGDIASWDVPGKALKGVGGAMDLVIGAKKVIVAMTHCDRAGNTKIVEKCTLPLTAAGEVDYVVTEMAVIAVKDGHMVLEAIAPDVTLDEVLKATGAKLVVSDELGQMIE